MPSHNSAFLRKLTPPLSAICLSIALTGCGVGPVDTSVNGALHVEGMVHGGQNGVSGANVVLYAVGTGGLGSASTNKMTTAVTTDKFGFFGITGEYHCGSSTDQMYLAAVGGDPGDGVSNPALVLVAALGDCGNLQPSTTIVVNEVTTAAAAWAIGQFATSYDHIGATPTNATGIRNAFLDARLLADSSTGAAATIPANLTTEPQKLYALADALAPCVNSTGASGGPCGTLFAAANNGGTAPTDTFMAAINIVQHPVNHVSDVWSLIDAQAPFPMTLTQAPNDWSMSLTVTGGGLMFPTTLGLDKQGNVWVANYDNGGADNTNGLSAFTPQGTPMSGSPFATAYLLEVFGLAIDFSGNIWVTRQEYPTHDSTRGSVVKISGANGTTPGAVIGQYGLTDDSIDYPQSIAVDTSGNIDIGNYGNGTATIYNSTGSLIVGGVGAGHSSFPVGIVPDARNGVWLANDGETITHISFSDPANLATSTQTATVIPMCCSGAAAIASDKAGNIWVANSLNSTVSEVSASNSVLLNQVATDPGSPEGLFVDSAQNVWLLDYHGNSISKMAGSFPLQSAAGTILQASIGLDTTLVEPFSLQGDASGNIWVANNGNNNVIMFFGLAAPTAMPLTPFAAAP